MCGGGKGYELGSSEKIDTCFRNDDNPCGTVADKNDTSNSVVGMETVRGDVAEEPKTVIVDKKSIRDDWGCN